MNYSRILRLLVASAFLSLNSFAVDKTNCYRLSTQPDKPSPRGETMCVNLENQAEGLYSVSFYSGYNEMREYAASMNLKLVKRAKCLDCNQDSFVASTNPLSAFNIFSIEFEGKKWTDATQQVKEKGVVRIGTNTLYYVGPVIETIY